MSSSISAFSPLSPLFLVGDEFDATCQRTFSLSLAELRIRSINESRIREELRAISNEGRREARN